MNIIIFHLSISPPHTPLPHRPSFADLNLRDLCWFILALGATPSIAMYSSRRGRMMLNILSIYSNMANIIWSSSSGAALRMGEWSYKDWNGDNKKSGGTERGQCVEMCLE